jgi:hypothetical protein
MEGPSSAWSTGRSNRKVDVGGYQPLGDEQPQPPVVTIVS